jgi:hypothetical protein
VAGSGSGTSVPSTPVQGRFWAFRRGGATRYLRKFSQVKQVAAPGSVAATLFAAATPSGHRFPGYLILIGLVVIVPAGYVASCWWWPFARCWRCDGTGRFARKDGRVWRNCRRCKGSGRRLRIGRWLWNWATSLHRDAS